MTKLKHLWNKRKGFTLIELVVVMAIIGILVLLAAPRFLGQTDEANATKHVSNARTLEDASERYFMDHGDWPRLRDEAYDSAQINQYSERIRDITGEEVTLTDGNYYEIDYEALNQYAKLPDAGDRENYILRNPVGKVYYLENLTEAGKNRVDYDNTTEEDEEPLYAFDTFTFTHAGATGRFGPTQEQLNSAYEGTVVKDYIVSENGIQEWTVPKSGIYRIVAHGAQGGHGYLGSDGGSGAIIEGDFSLYEHEIVNLVIGQQGLKKPNDRNANYGGSGGGGTFVWKAHEKALLIASGGGGGGLDSWSSPERSATGYDATVDKNGLASNNGAQGGVDGHGGSATNIYSAGGGLGWLGSGHDNANSSQTGGEKGTFYGGENRYVQGENYGMDGGFGGGGASMHGGGGGGGYSGGGGGDNSVGNGGGGGSFNSGTNQQNSVGNTGHGKVIITFISE